MATERLSMRQTREILRQKWSLGRTHREVAQSLRISTGAVGTTVLRARAAGLDWAQVDRLSDDVLHARVYGPPPPPTHHRAVPDCAYLHAERRRPGVTVELLHLEYLEQHPDGYRYTQFCECYRRWLGRRGLSMRQVHRAGAKLFVDYAGKKPTIIDATSGEVKAVELFVAALGASNYTYAEATRTQQVPDWVASHQRAFQFFGGVTEAIVPDQLKSGVVIPCRYEPGVQRTYDAFAQHYGTVILPARPAKPRDKAKIEVAVQIVERWILARLRHETFFSLAALNARIAELLADLQRLEDRRPREHRLSHRAPRSLLLRPLRARARARRRVPDRDHRRNLSSRPARRRSSAADRPRPTHQRSRAHAEGSSAPPRMDALASHRLGPHHRPAHRRAGPSDSRGSPASRAGLSLVPRDLALGQARRRRAARGRLRPRRRGRRALLPPRRLDPQAPPRSARAAGSLSATHPHSCPRTSAWPGLLPVKERRCSMRPRSRNSTPSSSTRWPPRGPTNSSTPTPPRSPSTSAWACSSRPSGSRAKNKRLGRALQEAKLKLPQACLEAIDYPARRELDKAVIRQLATCRWIDEHHNVILVGATGVGKSFVACPLAHQACRKGYRALYRRASRLFHELILARADGTYVRLLTKLARLDVLVIDDWGLAPVQEQERRDLLEILEDRYGTRSTIVTSQLPPAQWHEHIGDATLADAICDRLLHNAHRLVLKGPSRRKEAKLDS